MNRIILGLLLVLLSPGYMLGMEESDSGEEVTQAEVLSLLKWHLVETVNGAYDDVNDNSEDNRLDSAIEAAGKYWEEKAVDEGLSDEKRNKARIELARIVIRQNKKAEEKGPPSFDQMHGHSREYFAEKLEYLIKHSENNTKIDRWVLLKNAPNKEHKGVVWEECPICMENDADMLAPTCKQHICKSCWKGYVEEALMCPFCRFGEEKK